MQSFEYHPHLSTSPSSTLASPKQAYDISGPTYDAYNAYDDSSYRFSSETDRGFPREGMYAQDGLWDEEDTTSETTTLRPTSSSTFGTYSKRRQSSKVSASVEGSISSRGRSGTVSSPMSREADEKSRSWSWSRKNILSSSIQMEVKMDAGARKVRKEKSMSKLKGLGRRGELSLEANIADESFEAPCPSPPMALLHHHEPSPQPSPLDTVDLVSPPPLPTPEPDTDSYSPEPAIRMDDSPESIPPQMENIPPHTKNKMTDPLPKRPKQFWRKGVKDLFKSKSSMALREAFALHDPNQPSPGKHPLPKPSSKAMGKAFSSSTPPMPDQSRMLGFLGSPLLSGSPSIPSTSPQLPSDRLYDPFASNLYLASNTLPGSPGLDPPQLPATKMPRQSPSLRDLKNLLPSRPSRPSLTKAKSYANIKEKSVPASAPPDKTEFEKAPPLPSKFPKRVKSAVGLSSQSDLRPMESIAEDTSQRPLPRPQLIRMPTESPPLMPPQPPFFPFTSSLATPSTPTSTPMGSETPLRSPGIPLPAVPISTPDSMFSSTPMKRSGSSGPILLPRSRSTSMSLKSPPTSSSFFDLYEQLGIWPTSRPMALNKEAEDPNLDASIVTEKAVSADALSKRDSEDGKVLTQSPVQMSESPSLAFSITSWENTLSKFPLFVGDTTTASNKEDVRIERPMFDFGHPVVGDTEDLTDLVDQSFSGITGIGEFLINGAMSDTSTRTVSASNHYGASVGAQRGTSEVQGTKSASQTHPLGGYTMSRGGSGDGKASDDDSNPGSRDETAESSFKQKATNHAYRRQAPRGQLPTRPDEEEEDVPLSELARQASQSKRPMVPKAEGPVLSILRGPAVPRKVDPRDGPGPRRPGHGWDGEGGAPAAILAAKLEAVLRLQEDNATDRLSRQPSQSVASSSKLLPQSVAVQRSQTLPDPAENVTSLQKRAGHVGLGIDFSRVKSGHGGADAHPDTEPAGAPGEAESMAMAGRSQSQREPIRQYPGTDSVDMRRANTNAPLRPDEYNSSDRLRASAQDGREREVRVSPEMPSRFVSVPVRIHDGNGRRGVMELASETQARDLLRVARQKGFVGDPLPGLDWVVVEAFAELNCQRQLREWENLEQVMKGWNPTLSINHFGLRQSKQASQTFARSLPSTAPFLGVYVQYETKKGKWSKKYLETRGGQLFLSKNEKGKEEVHINTLFHDVYAVERPKGAPKPFNFIVKRDQMFGSVVNDQEYILSFSVDDQTGPALIAVIYNAKSFAMHEANADVFGHHVGEAPRKPRHVPLLHGDKSKEKESIFVAGTLMAGLESRGRSHDKRSPRI